MKRMGEASAPCVAPSVQALVVLGAWLAIGASAAGAAERATATRVAAAEMVTIRSGTGQVVMQRIEPRMQWKDLRRPEATRRALRKIEAEPRVKQGTAVLFSGEDRAAKLRAAEVLAAEMHLAFYRVDLAEVVSKYLGETEKNLDQVFAAAKAGSAVLFFDEADALFGKRTDVSDSHDRHANQEISYLLQRIERFDGLAILATNQAAEIDPAVLRRFRHVVEFAPDGTGRSR